MATETVTLVVQSVSRVLGEENATITLGNQYAPPIYLGSTIQINNRRDGSYLPTATVVEIVDSATIVVTGLSEQDVSDFAIPQDEIGAVGYITNTYPISDAS